MEFSGIIQNISKHIALDDREVASFAAVLHKKVFLRRETILRAGNHCHYINYVEHGVLRAYHSGADAEENIVMFAIKDWWITDMYSFATGNLSVMSIDALEDTTVYQLHRNDLDKLFIEIPKFERFFRIIMQNAYIREQLRVIDNLSLSAEQRHINFLKKYPQFAQRIPLKQIASYLGITPEFLSVLRKRALKKNS